MGKHILKAGEKGYGAHMSHCNQEEYLHHCKYGEDDICPAVHHKNSFKDPREFAKDSNVALVLRAAGAYGAKFDVEAIEAMLDSGVSLEALHIRVKARANYLRDVNSPEAAKRLSMLPWDELAYEMAATCGGTVPMPEEYN